MTKFSGAVVMIAVLISITTLAVVYAQPVPHGIQGIVYMSDGVTETPVGTSFSVNDTTSGFFIEGTTGAGSHSGWYSVSITGSDGDTVLIKAGNDTTHYGERAVILVGDMTAINVLLTNLSLEPPHAASAPTTASRSGDGSADEAALTAVTPTATPVSTIATPAATSVLTPAATIAPTTPLSSPAPESNKNLPGFEFYLAFFVLIVSYLLKKK